MHSTEIRRVINCIHITVILYFHLELMSKTASLKMLGLKLVKLGCLIIQFDLAIMSWMEPVACLLLQFESSTKYLHGDI